MDSILQGKGICLHTVAEEENSCSQNDSVFWNRVSSSHNVRQTKYIFITKKVLAIYANLCYSTKMSVSMGKCAFLFVGMSPVGDMST